tara:strand:- start:13013 stop:13498 length:486 start_codon:yes stop_codon:yes gene_type:complete
MAVINVTPGTECILTLGNTAPLAVPAVSGGMVIPLLQDVTVNASPGIVRYSTLDSSSSSAFTTVNENSISVNMLLDEQTFFGLDAAGGTNKIADDGLFQASVDKTEVFFSVAFQGSDTGDHIISGKGFISGLAPTASMDAAVWLTPMEIVVNGELTKSTAA